MALKSINPWSNHLIEEFEEHTDKQISDLLLSSAVSFEKWKENDFGSRKSLIRNVSSLLRKNIAEYSNAISTEMGKPVTESRAEIEKCAWVCDYYADKAEEFLRDEMVETDADISFIKYEPLGPILGIMPWNFPFWQVFRFSVPTIMAGNTVLLKHASNVQICARHIENIFRDSGLPPSVFTNLVVGSERAGKIIDNDLVRAVSLTGSEYAGQKVGEAAGRNIKKSLLELGGSNAFVVLDDADVEKAVQVGFKARMANAGQSCIAAKRFILHQDIYERFIRLFISRIKNIKVGDPLNVDTEMGPLSDIRQAEAVERQVKVSVEMGAKILEGGKRDNAFYSPTMVADVVPGMPLFDEEIFGPVAPVISVKNASEAIDLANRSKFGLGVSVFTGDLRRMRELAGEFKDGAVFINDLVKSDPRLPFGGTGRSGYGRELSAQGIREFVNIKTVYVKSH